MNNFVIRNISNKDLFWSNDEGWTDSDNFEVFTLEETETLTLPMGGEWVRIRTQ